MAVISLLFLNMLKLGDHRRKIFSVSGHKHLVQNLKLEAYNIKLFFK